MTGTDRPALRDDGATRGDRNEATALVVAGACLLVLPGVVVADRLPAVWFWVAAVVATGATLVMGLGLRWFLLEGPTLGTLSSVDEAGIIPASRSSFPVSLRLVEARNRMRAHILRFVALGSGLVLLVVDVGVFGWLVVGLFGVSFVADHILLRPKNYLVTEEDIGGVGWLTRTPISWESVKRVHWRRYPGKERPPFPGGERIVIEETDGQDVEFVFAPSYGGSRGDELVAAVLAVAEGKVRILQPRSQGRDLGSSSEMSPASELAHLTEDDGEAAVPAPAGEEPE